MEFGFGSASKNPHFSSYGAAGLQFNTQVEEIVLLDRWGHVVWQKRRLWPLETLRWEGRDIHGDPVGVGAYTCKIVYPGKQPVYLPFIFIR